MHISFKLNTKYSKQYLMQNAKYLFIKNNHIINIKISINSDSYKRFQFSVKGIS